jgi:hypothetical protein
MDGQRGVAAHDGLAGARRRKPLCGPACNRVSWNWNYPLKNEPQRKTPHFARKPSPFIIWLSE